MWFLAQTNPAVPGAPGGPVSPAGGAMGAGWWILALIVIAVVAVWRWTPARRAIGLDRRDRNGRGEGDGAR